MSDQNYTTSFTVDQSPEEVFAAINNVRGWWSQAIEGSTDKLGAEFIESCINNATLSAKKGAGPIA